MGEKKQDKPKKEEKKKEEKKDDAEEEDDDVPKEKPSKDPFAALPKGTFVMDDWKKCYSNEDTEKVAIPYFWKNLDKENYSVWYGKYKYPEDLKMVFMTCNLIGGMFQRLDKLRKYGFGTMCVMGKDNDNTISGVWFWRGQDLAFDLSEDLQTDAYSYEWKKLDVDNAEHKKMI